MMYDKSEARYVIYNRNLTPYKKYDRNTIIYLLSVLLVKNEGLYRFYQRHDWDKKFKLNII